MSHPFFAFCEYTAEENFFPMHDLTTGFYDDWHPFNFDTSAILLLHLYTAHLPEED